MLRFHASMVGSRSGLGRAIDETALPGFGSRPDAGIAVTGGKPGPFARVRGNPSGLIAKDWLPPDWEIDWLVRMGRFCVDEWPKIEPKMPRSKLRPYPE